MKLKKKLNKEQKLLFIIKYKEIDIVAFSNHLKWFIDFNYDVYSCVFDDEGRFLSKSKLSKKEFELICNYLKGDKII